MSFVTKDILNRLSILFGCCFHTDIYRRDLYTNALKSYFLFLLINGNLYTLNDICKVPSSRIYCRIYILLRLFIFFFFFTYTIHQTPNMTRFKFKVILLSIYIYKSLQRKTLMTRKNCY